MKNRENFYNELLEELELESVSTIDDDTLFKDLEEWDSMSLLIVINFYKQEANITLNPDIINNCTTLGELFSYDL